MANGNGATGDLIRHKFDLLLMVLVMCLMSLLIVLSEYWHDSTLIQWATNTQAGLVGAFINMIINRTSSQERVSDSPNTTVITTPSSTPKADVTVKTPNGAVTTVAPIGGNS